MKRMLINATQQEELRVALALKRRRVSVACVSNGNTAQLFRGTAWDVSPENIPFILVVFRVAGMVA